MIETRGLRTNARPLTGIKKSLSGQTKMMGWSKVEEANDSRRLQKYEVS